ncbi:mgmt family protein [Phaffia rhodozyma]|uniref:Mgmt family protein n=1 Tax=Phaffia rhodozyma TaxID=264483 RepID=A0A0F7SSG9_PHARH|nr:mgmt family protein [Phaffia rhodozyma]
MAYFHEQVYNIVRMIPFAKVTSYKHVATLAGHPRHSRAVGQALKFVQDPSIPWQRVIASSGTISFRGDDGGGAVRQREALESEGVVVTAVPANVALGGGKVSFSEFGWFPERRKFNIHRNMLLTRFRRHVLVLIPIAIILCLTFFLPPLHLDLVLPSFIGINSHRPKIPLIYQALVHQLDESRLADNLILEKPAVSLRADGRVVSKDCEALGWQSLEAHDVGEVWDAFVFTGNIYMLELRLAEMFDSVNMFFIVDMSPHSILPSRPSVISLPPGLNEYAGKLTISHLPSTASLEEAWDELTNMLDGHAKLREGQRKELKKGLEIGETVPEGRPNVLMGGADTILRSQVAHIVRQCKPDQDGGFRLGVGPYIYSFEHPLQIESHYNSLAISWERHKSKYGFGFNSTSSQRNMELLKDSGWECVGCYPKIENYVALLEHEVADNSHQIPEARMKKSKERIQHALCTGQDIFKFLPGSTYWNSALSLLPPSSLRSTLNLPQHLMKERKRLSWLLPEGCERDLGVVNL